MQNRLFPSFPNKKKQLFQQEDKYTNNYQKQISTFFLTIFFNWGFGGKILKNVFYTMCMLWSREGSNDSKTRKWVIGNILKENSTYNNDSWEKPLLSLTQLWIWLFLLKARRELSRYIFIWGRIHM